MAYRESPIEHIKNVGWPSAGLFVLLNFTSHGFTEDTVVVNPLPQDSDVVFSWRNVIHPPPDPTPPSALFRYYAWMTVSPAYIWGNVGGGQPGIIQTGDAGC